MFWSVQENSIEEEQCLNHEQSIMDESGAAESEKFEGHGITLHFISLCTLYYFLSTKYYEYNVLIVSIKCVYVFYIYLFIYICICVCVCFYTFLFYFATIELLCVFVKNT